MKLLKVSHFLVTVLLFFICTTQASAQVVLSEIMYDLDGSDSDREWVEIFNEEATAISLSGWKFYENDSNHTLTLIQGSESLPSGGYAIIVDDSDTFLLNWPGFSGTLFDSSFSLSNTGETLVIRNSELIDIDSVTYSSEWGAGGDGNSLYYTGSTWSPASATPGSGSLSAVVVQEEIQEENQEQSSNDNSVSVPSAGSSIVEPQIFAFAGDDRAVTVGASSLFKGEAVGIEGEKLENARYVWNFGDGVRKEGQSLLHYYRYPGEYVVTLEVSSGEYVSSDRVNISANEAKVAIVRGTPDVITVTNLDEYELDLSWWNLVVDGVSFMLPPHTIVLPQHEVHISSDITGLYPFDANAVSLQYPNGETVELYVPGYVKPTFENVPMQSTPRSYSQQPIVGVEVDISQQRETVEKTESVEHTPQTASVAGSIDREEDNSSVYWFTLAGIIIFGAVSSVVLRRKSREEITIIE